MILALTVRKKSETYPDDFTTTRIDQSNFFVFTTRKHDGSIIIPSDGGNDIGMTSDDGSALTFTNVPKDDIEVGRSGRENIFGGRVEKDLTDLDDYYLGISALFEKFMDELMVYGYAYTNR